jgi:hypothetical protein
VESRDSEIKRKDLHTAASAKNVSAEELARIYMESRPDFLIMDMEEVTRGWNVNFIFDFLYHVRKLSDIDLAIEWLAEKWADTHHYYDTYNNLKDPKLVEEHRRFVLLLKDIKDSLISRFEAEERKEALRVQMLMGYNTTTTTEVMPKEDVPQKKSDETDSPHFKESNSSGLPEYHIKDLPDDVRGILTFDDDETYSLFVKNMNEDTWLKVNTNKGKYLDRLRFVCNKFEITAKNTDRKQFDKLLHYIIPDLGEIGNLESAMKKQKDSNDKANYKYYDSPEFYHRSKCYDLCKVGAELEECLTPVLEKLHHKKWNTKKNPR